ncbi:MAG: hypothetical protein Q8M54_05600 [Desulfobaccales bacterium]|nr:hypothetical protein [Desulfobaccales bacterium]
MDFYQFLNLLVLLVILGFFWSFKGYFSKFGEEIAKSTTANINFADEIRRMVANEEAKAITLRLDATKAEGAMKLQGLMAEIESLLVNWRLTAYFHRDELKEDETIEDLGQRDLKKVSQIILQLLKEANAYSVLLGDDILAAILNWVKEIHKLIFEYEAVYQTSKKSNEGKSVDHIDRVNCIEGLIKVGIDPKINQIAEIRGQIKMKLSENVRKTISDLAKL